MRYVLGFILCDTKYLIINLYETGADPDSLRLKLSHGEQIVLGSGLDTLCNKLQTWEAQKATSNKFKKEVSIQNKSLL
jgi:hypothetical protein